MTTKRLFCLILLLTSILIYPQKVQAEPGIFRVYLTFEDGPTDAYTPQILDILAGYNAKATFFVAGYQLAGREYLLQRMMREGHAIGNHLWVEPGFYAGATDEVIREAYLQTEAAIRAALGSELPRYEAQVKLYRQPGGGSKPFPSTEGVQVITYNWNVSGNDCGSSIDFSGDFDTQVLRNLFESPFPPGRPYYNVYDYGDGVIVVLHDINRVTGRVLPTILSRLAEAGATFEALPRPWDVQGTVPAILGTPPVFGSGIPGVTLPAVTVNNSRIRTLPDLNAPILIESVPYDTPVILSGRSGEWFQVQYAGQTGWMFRENVRVLGPIPNLPLIP